ncbi:MAG: hypothetical protein JRI25_28815, partial [Deltaproteobacteria bacterium]|nr:hypothetical protein [Deltaproteobacteria bacterium]
MRGAHRNAGRLGAALLCVAVCGCESGSQTFIGGRLANLCNESYYTC